MTHEYTEQLNVSRQVNVEEHIAAVIFDKAERSLSEERCAELGREILKTVLMEFRPDLIVDSGRKMGVWLDGNVSEGFTAYGPFDDVEDVFADARTDMRAGWGMSLLPAHQIPGESNG